MNFDDIDFPEMTDIALGNIIPDSVRIRQMEKEMENERYEELKNRIGNIEEYSKSQAKSMKDEIFFLDKQLKLAMQRAENAETGERKANRIAVISAITSIITLLISVVSVIISLISAGLI